MNEKTTVIIGILGALLLGVIATAIAWILGKDTLAPHSKEVMRRFLNVEITLLILGLIPFLTPIVIVANIVCVVLAFMAVNNGTELKIPAFNFVK